MTKINFASTVALHFPPPSLCTGNGNTPKTNTKLISSREDNAVMIGWAAMHRFLTQDYDEYSIDLRPNWSIDRL